jgi:hypothetical protein
LRALTRPGAAASLAGLALLGVVQPALAHGGVTGAQDLVQDNLALLFLLAIVLIGAGVLAWVMLSPQRGVDESEETPSPDD